MLYKLLNDTLEKIPSIQAVHFVESNVQAKANMETYVIKKFGTRLRILSALSDNRQGLKCLIIKGIRGGKKEVEELLQECEEKIREAAGTVKPFETVYLVHGIFSAKTAEVAVTAIEKAHVGKGDDNRI
jgi:hypothetical protein